MKFEVIKEICLPVDRYDPSIFTFWNREKKSILLAKDSSLKSEGYILVNSPENPRYFLSKKDSSNKIYVSYSPLYTKILKTIYDVCCEEENKNDSAEIIFKKIFDDENLLERIYYFDESFRPSYLENFNSFLTKIRIDTLLYFDDGEDQYYFELFRKLDKDKTSQKQEFTGGILHSLTKHFNFFNHYHPKSNDNLDFEFKNFTSSIVDISLNGETTDFKNGSYPNEYIIEKELELTDYYPIKEGKMFKVVLYQQANKLNYLKTFYRY